MDPSSCCILDRPKYVQNVASAIRACAAFGSNTLLFTGNRFDLDSLDRTPREFRMKDYRCVDVLKTERPFDMLPIGTVPVCVEVAPVGTVDLVTFQHPINAAYVFGPEDGEVCQVFRRFCHHFVYIPSRYCLNLAAAMNIVLFDRCMKLEKGAE